MVLVILDGWGYRETAEHNAIAAARKPVWDRLWAHYPHTLIRTSGAAVGLPAAAGRAAGGSAVDPTGRPGRRFLPGARLRNDRGGRGSRDLVDLREHDRSHGRGRAAG